MIDLQCSIAREKLGAGRSCFSAVSKARELDEIWVFWGAPKHAEELLYLLLLDRRRAPVILQCWYSCYSLGSEAQAVVPSGTRDIVKGTRLSGSNTFQYGRAGWGVRRTRQNCAMLGTSARVDARLGVTRPSRAKATELETHFWPFGWYGSGRLPWLF